MSNVMAALPNIGGGPPPIFGRAAITLGIGPHSSGFFFFLLLSFFLA